ncbi:hypothetical protein [uncultured Phascolarctobacterium sp.]|uniref:hypothetical protein n=1 Tax=Phascolarctobacterium sp. TaxID=2049039 RepID=UPI0025F28F52|nr:hypothetical protein [uncultured Phascolarctobacterium sp.]
MSEAQRFNNIESCWLSCVEPQAVGACSWCGEPIYAGEEFADTDSEGAVCMECIEGLSGRELIEALRVGKIKFAEADRG